MSESFKSPIQAEASLELCASNEIEFEGQKFTPDETKGYFQFSFSYAFPVRNAHGTAVAPAVIGASYKSLLHQPVNWEHMMQAYHKKPGERTSVTDRILGSVVAVSFQTPPMGGWRMSADASKAPFITAVGTYAKLAQGMNHVVGDHLGGRHRYAVSLEIDYSISKSGFAVALNSAGPSFNFTPPDMLEAGYEFVPYLDAPEDLRECFSRAKNRIVRDWKKREVTVLMGGLSNPVHYAGVAIVKYGAEPTAKINRMAASAPSDIVRPFSSLKDLLKKSLTQS